MVTRPHSKNESNKHPDSDETLMTRLREGDDLALNALMERWEQPLIGFATRYTNNRSDALELAQETFVRVYENRKRYRAKGKFSTWMFSIAANLCKNHARWKRRHPSVAQVTDDGVDLAEALPSTNDSPDAKASVQMRRSRYVARFKNCRTISGRSSCYSSSKDSLTPRLLVSSSARSRLSKRGSTGRVKR